MAYSSINQAIYDISGLFNHGFNLVARLPESSFPVLVVENGFVQVFFSKVGPANIGKVQLGVG